MSLRRLSLSPFFGSRHLLVVRVLLLRRRRFRRRRCLCVASSACTACTACTACIRCHILCAQVKEFIPMVLKLRLNMPMAPSVPVVRAGSSCCHSFRCSPCCSPCNLSFGALLLWHDVVAGLCCRLMLGRAGWRAALVWTSVGWCCGTRPWDAQVLRPMCQQSVRVSACLGQVLRHRRVCVV
jgi:hypothetical protein